MIQFIPTQAIPNQRFQIVLGGQNCIIHLYQRGKFMYMDLNCNGNDIRRGAICLTSVDLVQYPTPNFDGLLFFTDIKNHDHEPVYNELGTRYFLCYDDGADE